MMRYSEATKLFYSIVCLLVLINLSGCSNPTSQSGGVYEGSVEWYQMSDGTVIPVFLRDGTYYSVCRGVEVPLSKSAEGLVWSQGPSSMTGTTIGQNRQDGGYFIAIVDRQRENIEETFVSGKKQTIKKIEPPFAVPNPVIKAPRSNDDFIGWYCPMWFPWIKIEIRKEGKDYLQTDHELHDPGQWVTMETKKVTKRTDGLGLVLYRDSPSLIYNAKHKRYELSLGESEIWRIPLVRIQPDQEILSELVRIGIPSWH